MRGRLPDIDLHGNDFGLEYRTVAPKTKMRDKVVKVKDIHKLIRHIEHLEDYIPTYKRQYVHRDVVKQDMQRILIELVNRREFEIEYED